MQLSVFCKGKYTTLGPCISKICVIMRLTTIFIIVVILHASAEGVSQQRVTLSKKDAPIENVFNSIRSQTGYNFLYSNNVVRQSNTVSINVKNVPLQDALDQCMKDQPLIYHIINRTIIVEVSHKENKASPPDDIEVTGTVSDEKGNPLSGVSIQIKNTSAGTVTDDNGNFKLTVPDKQAVLLFTYIGYTPVQKTVGNNAVFNIILTAENKGLNELVVVGYGQQKKVDLTGAISQISGNTIRGRPVVRLTQALQGVMPGLTVQQNNGSPGAKDNLTIRGISSLNSSGSPLVIVDGIPGDINNINPEDVESITVLKDASSTAIYGARAANGVILIKTKEGEGNGLKVEFHSNVVLKTPTMYPPLNDAVQNAKLANLAFTNAGASPLFTESQIKDMSDPSVTAIPNADSSDYIYVGNFNWYKYFFQHSFQQRQNIILSGGGKANTFFVSGSWTDNRGYFAKYGPDSYNNYSIRYNDAYKLIPGKLILRSYLNLSVEKYRKPSVGYDVLVKAIQDPPPNMPLYNPDGTYARYKMQENALQDLQEAGFDDVRNNNFLGRISMEWNVIKHLSINALAGYNYTSGNETQWDRAYYKYTPKGPTALSWRRAPNNLILGNSYTNYYNAHIYANYTNTFGDHRIDLLLGGEMEHSYSQNQSTERQNLQGNNLPSITLGDPTTATNNWNVGEWGVESGFARLRYNYKEKYLLEASLRADGSSKFPPKYRWGYFPAISAGWRITQERFMQKQKIFSTIKLRGSYGEVGNESGLGNYDYIAIFRVPATYIPFPAGKEQVALNPYLASNERTWETIEIKDIGLDIGFLNDRLSITADAYIKNNKDMLIAITVPSTIGITVPTSNNGSLQTKGWEVSIRWNSDVKSIGLQYNVNFNLSNNTNKLTKLDKGSTVPTGGFNNIQGYPANSIFGYQADGYFQSEDEIKNSATQNANTSVGDLKYVDQNGNGKIKSPEDLIYMGTDNPQYVFGTALGASWKRFDISALFQGVGKRRYYLNSNTVGVFLQSYVGWSYQMMNDYWTPDNTHARFPRPVLKGSWNFNWSSHWLQNAAYIRLKNIQVGYRLPSSLLKKIDIEAARIYFSGDNLWTMSHMWGFDPELGSVDPSSVYPINKLYSLGLDITF
jgi:TonB-linked SusC/RagA family outer membrane protein